MLRLNQIFFKNLLRIFFFIFLLGSVMGYYLLQSIEISNHKLMLKNMIEQFVSTKDSIDEIELVLKDINKKSHIRVTIIASDGTVMYENSRPVEGMDNHINRPEIEEAKRDGYGFSTRYSKSINEDLLYVAKVLNDGSFVRMAYSLESIKKEFFSLWLKMVLLFGVALVLGFWLSLRIKSKISDDAQKIEQSLENLLNKQYDSEFIDGNCCKEFRDISNSIQKVSQKLKKRDKQKAKYTKKLKLLSKKQSDIISAISHEFKNPVAAIMGYAQSIKEDQELSSEVRDRFLEKILNNSQKISSMIDRLSLAIKLENETSLPNISEFGLKPLINEVKDTLLQKYRGREIVLDVEDVRVKADRSMFDNLFTNLMDNALKYSENKVVVKVKNGEVSIIDKGIGIEEKHLQDITKRFFRVDELTWDNSIGVGLYIVKYILKLHNLMLYIESQPHKGSRFSFSIAKITV